ncbi:MAG: aminomethyltransferase family protein [Candidatus Binatia bacterium]
MVKDSLLAELHRTNGADFREEGGWSLPLHFGESLQEYDAVRSQVGLLDLCHRSLLRFTGPDRLSYLQGMVSNDVNGLDLGEGTYAAVLDIHGRILADIRLFCTEDCFLLDFWEPLKEKIVAHLHCYLIADEVEVTDLTEQFRTVSLQGPKSRNLLEWLLGNDRLPSKELSHAEFQTGDGSFRVIRATHTGEEGFDLMIGIKDLLPVVSRLQETGKSFSYRWVGSQAQELLRVEAGIPRYGVDIDEDNLLLETGLDHAVSFQKGCYLGQEVVERIHSRGHINKRLVGMVLEGDAAAQRGDTINGEQKQIGKVTSSILSPVLKCPLALGYVHRDYTSPETRVTIQSKGKTIPAVVTRLPFYKP